MSIYDSIGKGASGVLDLIDSPSIMNLPDQFDPKLQPDSTKEQEKVAAIRHLFQDAKSFKEPWASPWETVFEMTLGKQWGDVEEWRANPVENYMLGTLTNMVARVLTNRPTFQVRPREKLPQGDPADPIAALQSELKDSWVRQNMDQVVEHATTGCFKYSAGFYYTYWDVEQRMPCTKAVDATNIFANKDATSIEDAVYIIHVCRMPAAELFRRFPGAKGKVGRGQRTVDEPDSFKASGFREDGDSRLEAGFESGNSGAIVPYVSANLDEPLNDNFSVQVLDVWIRDPSLGPKRPLIDPETNLPVIGDDGEPEMVRSPKYPGGRQIVMAGNRIVHDAPNPYWHGQFPFVKQAAYVVENEFWGISPMQMLVSPQRELNKVVGQIIDNKNAIGNGQWIVDRNSGVEEDALTSRPGIVVWKNPGTEVRREMAPPLPDYIMQFYFNCRRAIDDLSGIPDAAQGRKPTGIQSGVAIQALNNAADTKMGILVRHLEDAMQKLGTQWLGLMRQFVDQARMVRHQDPQTGETVFLELTPDMVKRNYDVEIVPGSTLPVNKEFRHQQAVELLQIGAIDQESCLTYIDWPDAYNVLKRIKEREAMQYELAKMQAMGAGGGAGAGGGKPPAQKAA